VKWRRRRLGLYIDRPGKVVDGGAPVLASHERKAWRVLSACGVKSGTTLSELRESTLPVPGIFARRILLEVRKCRIACDTSTKNLYFYRLGVLATQADASARFGGAVAEKQTRSRRQAKVSLKALRSMIVQHGITGAAMEAGINERQIRRRLPLAERKQLCHRHRAQLKRNRTS